MGCHKCKAIRHCSQRKRLNDLKRDSVAPICIERYELFISKCPCSECIVKSVCEINKDAYYHQFDFYTMQHMDDQFNCKVRMKFSEEDKEYVIHAFEEG